MLTSLKHTDPTYLRTIHDALLSGAVHTDNASALPQGLVGMYEEALPPASNVNERLKFLEFFAVLALLKKEVITLLNVSRPAIKAGVAKQNGGAAINTSR